MCGLGFTTSASRGLQALATVVLQHVAASLPAAGNANFVFRRYCWIQVKLFLLLRLGCLLGEFLWGLHGITRFIAGLLDGRTDFQKP